jgi:two-component system, NarL family, response regulator NreC
VDAYRIIIADRHRDFREAVRRVVAGQPGLDIAGEAWEGLVLLNLVRYCPPGPLLVILDVSLPNIPWMEAIRKVKEGHADTQVLVLSMHEDPEYLKQALSSGAEGYLMKESIDSEIIQAIETIREGKLYVSHALANSGSCQDLCGAVPG